MEYFSVDRWCGFISSFVNLLYTSQHLAELLDEQKNGPRAGVSDMDWLDNLSETGSILSQIDWAAMEKMVAAEEAWTVSRTGKILRHVTEKRENSHLMCLLYLF